MTPNSGDRYTRQNTPGVSSGAPVDVNSNSTHCTMNFPTPMKMISWFHTRCWPGLQETPARRRGPFSWLPWQQVENTLPNPVLCLVKRFDQWRHQDYQFQIEIAEKSSEFRVNRVGIYPTTKSGMVCFHCARIWEVTTFPHSLYITAKIAIGRVFFGTQTPSLFKRGTVSAFIRCGGQDWPAKTDEEKFVLTSEKTFSGRFWSSSTYHPSTPRLVLVFIFLAAVFHSVPSWISTWIGGNCGVLWRYSRKCDQSVAGWFSSLFQNWFQKSLSEVAITCTSWVKLVWVKVISCGRLWSESSNMTSMFGCSFDTIHALCWSSMIGESSLHCNCSGMLMVTSPPWSCTTIEC